MKEESKTDCCCDLVALQVTWFSPPARKGRGEEVVADPPVCLDFTAAARESTRRQWRWRVEETHRHCSRAQKPSATAPAPRNLPATVPADSKGLPRSFLLFFRSGFCNFGMLRVCFGKF
jgi:hypothetical protein